MAKRKQRIPKKIRMQLLRDAGHQCSVCSDASTVDAAHIIHERHGGKVTIENLIALCPSCHRKYDREWNSTRPNALNTDAILGYKERQVERSRDKVLERLKKLEEDKTTRSTEQWLTNRVDSLEAENAELKAKLAATEQGSPEWQAASSKLVRKWKAADLFTSGLEEYRKAHYQAALQNWEASRELDPTKEVFNNLGTLYRIFGRLGDAFDAYDKTERLRKEQGLPDDPRIAMNRGNVFQDLARFDDALKAYDEAEQMSKDLGLPTSPNILANRGAVYIDLAQNDDALATYDDAERLRKEQGLPDDPRIAVNRGVVYYCLGRYDEALEAFDEAERLRLEQGLPQNPNVNANRGVVYWYQERYEDALAAYDFAEQERQRQGLPDIPGLADNRGETYRKLGQFDKAEEYYCEAENLRKELGLPEEPTTTFNRGQVLFDQGDIKGACKLTHRAQEMYKGTQMVVSKEITEFIDEHCSEG